MELQAADLLKPLIFNPEGSFKLLFELKEGSAEELLNENLWGFEKSVWFEIKKEFITVERFYAAIYDIRNEIHRIKEFYREQAIDLRHFQVEMNTRCGISGSYFLSDAEGSRKYLIKPLDEDAGCIHSTDYFSPFVKSPFRDHIPLYLSSMRETLAYQVACMIGVGSIIPKTQIGILESPLFHDFSESICAEERKRYEEICGYADKEKLCSSQEYVENSKPLFEALHHFYAAQLSDDEIAARLDQKDFEEINILLWTNYDTDGHLGNCLVYPKGVDEVGNEILGLKKIDSGLAFPDKNEQLRNNLAFLPNAKKELSMEAKRKIAAIDVDQLAVLFEKMGLESAISAMKERIPILQELINRDGITIKEINTELSKIGKKG